MTSLMLTFREADASSNFPPGRSDDELRAGDRIPHAAAGLSGRLGDGAAAATFRLYLLGGSDLMRLRMRSTT